MARARALIRRLPPVAAARDRRRFAQLRNRPGLKVNVGSNDAHVPGWVSVDLHRDAAGQVLRMDATRPWPFPAGTVEAVNSEHMVEHLAPDDVLAFFHHAFHALRDRKSTRLNSSHGYQSRMPSSA